MKGRVSYQSRTLAGTCGAMPQSGMRACNLLVPFFHAPLSLVRYGAQAYELRWYRGNRFALYIRKGCFFTKNVKKP